MCGVCGLVSCEKCERGVFVRDIPNTNLGEFHINKFEYYDNSTNDYRFINIYEEFEKIEPLRCCLVDCKNVISDMSGCRLINKGRDMECVECSKIELTDILEFCAWEDFSEWKHDFGYENLALYESEGDRDSMKEYYKIKRKLLSHYYIMDEDEELFWDEDEEEACATYRGGRVEEGAECRDFEYDKMYYCNKCDKGECGGQMRHFGYYENYVCNDCSMDIEKCCDFFKCCEQEKHEVNCSNCECFLGSGDYGEKYEYYRHYQNSYFNEDSYECEVYCDLCLEINKKFENSPKITCKDCCDSFITQMESDSFYGRCESCYEDLDSCWECGDKNLDEENDTEEFDEDTTGRRCNICYRNWLDAQEFCVSCNVVLDENIVSSQDAFMCGYCWEQQTTNKEMSNVDKTLERNSLFKPCDSNEGCCICLSDECEIVERVCSHKFGRLCLLRWCKSQEDENSCRPKKTTCPLCRHSL
tara:strand:- start:68 stop:1483 length:1416 start_codon:yes stop_codon:yes gene_type:complete